MRDTLETDPISQKLQTQQILLVTVQTKQATSKNVQLAGEMPPDSREYDQHVITRHVTARHNILTN